MTALPHWAPSPAALHPRAYLRLVAHRRSGAARAPFIAVVVSLLLVGLLGLLVLHTVLAQDAFRLHALQTEARELVEREQALQREVSDLQSPHALAARATALGMVPGGSPTFLRLTDGKVLGRAEASATAPTALVRPVPVAAASTRQQSVTPKAKAKAKAKPAAPADGGWTVVKPASKTGARP